MLYLLLSPHRWPHEMIPYNECTPEAEMKLVEKCHQKGEFFEILPFSSAQTSGPPESPSQASTELVLSKYPAQNIVSMILSP